MLHFSISEEAKSKSHRSKKNVTGKVGSKRNHIKQHWRENISQSKLSTITMGGSQADWLKCTGRYNLLYLLIKMLYDPVIGAVLQHKTHNADWMIYQPITSYW